MATDTMVESTRIMKKPMTMAHSANHGLRPPVGSTPPTPAALVPEPRCRGGGPPRCEVCGSVAVCTAPASACAAIRSEADTAASSSPACRACWVSSVTNLFNSWALTSVCHLAARGGLRAPGGVISRAASPSAGPRADGRARGRPSGRRPRRCSAPAGSRIRRCRPLPRDQRRRRPFRRPAPDRARRPRRRRPGARSGSPGCGSGALGRRPERRRPGPSGGRWWPGSSPATILQNRQSSLAGSLTCVDGTRPGGRIRRAAGAAGPGRSPRPGCPDVDHLEVPDARAARPVPPDRRRPRPRRRSAGTGRPARCRPRRRARRSPWHRLRRGPSARHGGSAGRRTRAEPSIRSITAPSPSRSSLRRRQVEHPGLADRPADRHGPLARIDRAGGADPQRCRGGPARPRGDHPPNGRRRQPGPGRAGRGPAPGRTPRASPPPWRRPPASSASHRRLTRAVADGCRPRVRSTRRYSTAPRPRRAARSCTERVGQFDAVTLTPEPAVDHHDHR